MTAPALTAEEIAEMRRRIAATGGDAYLARTALPVVLDALAAAEARNDRLEADYVRLTDDAQALQRRLEAAEAEVTRLRQDREADETALYETGFRAGVEASADKAFQVMRKFDGEYVATDLAAKIRALSPPASPRRDHERRDQRARGLHSDRRPRRRYQGRRRAACPRAR